MKLIAVALLFVCLAFTGRYAVAQCIDIPTCIGETAENKERIKIWIRETEAARPSATPRPTNTPQPTATPRPTSTAIPTATPQPSATGTTRATEQPSATVQAVATAEPQQVKPKSNTSGYIVVFGTLALILAGLFVLIRGRTAIFPK